MGTGPAEKETPDSNREDAIEPVSIYNASKLVSRHGKPFTPKLVATPERVQVRFIALDMGAFP